MYFLEMLKHGCPEEYRVKESNVFHLLSLWRREVEFSDLSLWFSGSLSFAWAVAGFSILMDLKIQTKSSVIGSIISKSSFKYSVIGFVILK